MINCTQLFTLLETQDINVRLQVDWELVLIQEDKSVFQWSQAMN